MYEYSRDKPDTLQRLPPREDGPQWLCYQSYRRAVVALQQAGTLGGHRHQQGPHRLGNQLNMQINQ